MLAAKAAQVFGHDAVDLAGLHVLHHPLETGPFEVGAAPAIVYIFGENVQAVFGGILTQDGPLGLNADTVAVVLIVPAEAHIQSGVIEFCAVRLFHPKILLCAETTHAYHASNFIVP